MSLHIFTIILSIDLLFSMAVITLSFIYEVRDLTYLSKYEKRFLFDRCTSLVVHQNSLNWAFLNTDVQWGSYRIRADYDFLNFSVKFWNFYLLICWIVSMCVKFFATAHVLCWIDLLKWGLSLLLHLRQRWPTHFKLFFLTPWWTAVIIVLILIQHFLFQFAIFHSPRGVHNHWRFLH